MTTDQWITLGIILITIFLFITEWLAIDLIGLIIMSLLILTGILSPVDAIKGFSNSATVTIGCMFVLSAAILKTGHLKTAGNYLSQLLIKNKTKGILLLMLFTGFVSAFINNTPVVAVFIPIVLDAASKANVNASKILIPVSFASIFGGLCSLIGSSSNILISEIASENDVPAFGMFEMTPLGIILFATGILYLLSAGKKLLPDRGDKTGELSKKYQLGDYLTDIKLLPDSPSIGKPIQDSPLFKDLRIEIIGFRRKSDKIKEAILSELLQEGDILRVKGNVEQIKNIQNRQGIQIIEEHEWKEGIEDPENLMLAEVIITPGSELEGKTLSQTKFKYRFGSFALAIRSRDLIFQKKINKTTLRAGDILLVTANSTVINQYKAKQNEDETPFLIISEIQKSNSANFKNTILVAGIIISVILVASLNILPILASAILGVTLLVLFRFLDMQEVYKAINWKIIFMISGTMALGIALEKTGTAKLFAEEIINLVGAWGPVAIVSALFLLTSLLTELISNAASAVLLAPIAISAAQVIGIDPKPLLLTIMFAASASFMTPVGYQTNTMIYAAGNYKYTDFFRVGTPLNLLFWILVSILIPLYYNL